MPVKYHLKNPLWQTNPKEAQDGLRKYLERRHKQLSKWQPSSDRAQGIRDELLILVDALLGYDTNSLCIASLIPTEYRKTLVTEQSKEKKDL